MGHPALPAVGGLRQRGVFDFFFEQLTHCFWLFAWIDAQYIIVSTLEYFNDEIYLINKIVCIVDGKVTICLSILEIKRII